MRDDVAERPFQLAQPRFEIAPLIHAFRKQRPPHLLGTGCLYHSLSLVEAQTLFLEGQATVLKQVANLTGKIADQPFVVDAMDAPGQNAVVVSHQLNIAAVETADIIEAVREPDTGLEMLLEVREAAGQR